MSCIVFELMMLNSIMTLKSGLWSLKVILHTRRRRILKMAPFECLDLRICFSITRNGLIPTQLPHNGVGCLCIAYWYHWIWMWLLMRFVMFSYSNDSVTVLALLAVYTPGCNHIWPIEVFSSAHIHPFSLWCIGVPKDLCSVHYIFLYTLRPSLP